MILLTPGPCQTTETVRQAAAAPDLNHRSPAYMDLISEVKQRLLRVYPETGCWVLYLIGGSGTAAVEALVTSCIARGPVLLISNGYYTERIRTILALHHIPTDVLELGWLDPWTDETLARLEQMLKAGHYEAVLTCHHETTVGRLAPITQIGELAHRYGAHMLVDAVSSFGADPMDWNHLDAIASSANKNLHGIPGVSFVMANSGFEDHINSVERRTYYLHLPMYRSDLPAITPPVPALRALLQALRENPDGQPARKASYDAKIRVLRAGLAHLGFGIAVPAEQSSCCICTPTMPADWTYDQWFAANHGAGFVIYGCKGYLREKLFEVSVMGETTVADIESWINAVPSILANA